MKRLDIIISPKHVRDLDKLLYKHNVRSVSCYNVKGRGRTQSEPVSVGYSSITYVPEFVFRTKIEVAIPDMLAKDIISEILEVLGTGTGIMGKIFVYNITEAFDIQSRERDDDAI
jgi:nitrogen regulatory protein P-II 1